MGSQAGSWREKRDRREHRRRELPDRQRQIFDLADLQGFAPVEIAEMLEMNPATVRANLFKARRNIRRKILEKYPELAEGYEQ